MKKQPFPPKLADRLLQWFCRADLLDEIQGDLFEQFQRQVIQYGLHRAKWRYFMNVVSFIRPFSLKKKRNKYPNSTMMFRHNLLLTYRNFKRFKSSFLINLIGLSTGLVTVLLIYLWVNDELNVDKFHEKDSRLFRVMTHKKLADRIVSNLSTPAILGKALADEMAEVEYAANNLGSPDEYVISTADSHLKAIGQFASKDYFNIFSYDFIHGDKNQVLSDKNAVVISEALSVRLFNTTENIIGNVLEWEFPGIKKQLVVSGIFKSLPSNSSDQFDFVISFDLVEDFGWFEQHWGNFGCDTFLVLKRGTDINHFNDKIADFVKNKHEGSNVTLFAIPYSSYYLYETYENGVQAGGRIVYVRLFSIIAIFILVIACINFMNLSTAKASRRIKEVGIKKAVGAQRKTLIIQYLSESMIMAFLSLLIAILITGLLLPQFSQITGKYLTLNFDAKLVLSALATSLFTGFIAGSYPALYLSGFNPVIVLKGKLNTSMGELWTRKGLVIFQFMLSVTLIVSVLVLYKQIEFLQTKNLGYDKDHIISFMKEGSVADNQETFLSEMKNISGIVNASSIAHGMMLGKSSTFGTTWLDWEGKNPNERIQFEYIDVSYDMIETLGIKMEVGRAFSKNFSSDSSKVILNETAISVMGITDPIGKEIEFWGKKMEIVGVVKDFHFNSLRENVKPLLFKLAPRSTEKIMAKIEAGKELETIERLQKFYQKYNPGYSFNYKFLDTDYQAQYVAEKRVAVLSRYFAGVAIIISCLGLFGLAAFTAERRLKEIGIRKILGSGILGIIYLLSGDFTKMVLTAVIIALPLSYLLVKNWLNDFAYRIDLEWWFFVGAGLIALFIAWLTIGIQTVKAARINPSECLKDE